MSADGTNPSARRVAFVLEQTLGHITHSANLEALVPPAAAEVGIEPVFVPVPFDVGSAGRVPGWSNWTIRSGVRAQRLLRDATRSAPIDGMFVHTQVPAILLTKKMATTPTVVSIDATPLQYDSLGEFYRHDPGPEQVERLKHRLHERAFRSARRLVAWSTWARDGLVDDYGVSGELVSVIAPGVDVERWQPAPRAADDSRPLEVLFVGGDLPRKGGDRLIEACARLRDDNVPDFELHLVTTSEIETGAGVVVHNGVTPNSPELITRFRAADVFCLPTLGDCLPLVLAEAGAAGLPMISTSVGAIGEIVRPGDTGELVRPGDVDGLVAALRALLTDPARRDTYGTRARELVERDHDARVNAGRLLDVVTAAMNDG